MRGAPLSIAGLDIGSRTVGTVWLEHCAESGHTTEPGMIRMGLFEYVDAAGPLLFAGGVARNRTMRHLVADTHPCPLFAATEPHLAGVMGAALHGLETTR